MTKNDGSGFETEIRKSLEKFGEKNKKFYYERMPDYHEWIVLNPLLVHPKSTADFSTIYDGIPIYLEAKSSRSPSRFTLFHVKKGQVEATLKPHQKQRGLAISKAGGRYFVLINMRIPRKNRVFAFDVRTYARMEEAVFEGRTKNRRSITWVELEELLKKGVCFELELKKGKIWKLDSIYRAMR